MKGHRVTATLTNADPSAGPTTHHPVRTREQAVGRALAVVLGLLTIFGPISMDLYLPVLPALTTELQSATSTAQLTITACLLGLALGQLIAGPLSDRFGRRRPYSSGHRVHATSALRAFGGLAAPLVGLGGADNSVPLGLVTVVSATLAVTAYALTIKPRWPDRQSTRAHP